MITALSKTIAANLAMAHERILSLTDIERWSAGGQEPQPPSLLEKSTSAMSAAASNFAHAAKVAWTCAKTLFKECRS